MCTHMYYLVNYLVYLVSIFRETKTYQMKHVQRKEREIEKKNKTDFADMNNVIFMLIE